MDSSGHSEPEGAPGHRRRALPQATDVIVVGAGFAGAATAEVLARAGVAHGLLLEQEPVAGTHASGRNAAIARQVEVDPLLGALAIRSVRRLRERRVDGRNVLDARGGLYLFQAGGEGRAAAAAAVLATHDEPFERMTAQTARRVFPVLDGLDFREAIFSPRDGVVDIYALLMDLLEGARRGGIELVTSCTVEGLLTDGGRVTGVRTAEGDVLAPVVVDASGAWAGRLGREDAPLPLSPLRRHLFVGDDPADRLHGAPVIWDIDAGYYVRHETGGMLLCPCDETSYPPGIPPVDFAATELLAEKLLQYAPSLAEVQIRRSWACIRSFAPDRRPLIGADPEIRGLFHVSGLGGFGMTTCLAVGELAADRILGRPTTWFDVATVDPSRCARSRSTAAI